MHLIVQNKNQKIYGDEHGFTKYELLFNVVQLGGVHGAKVVKVKRGIV